MRKIKLIFCTVFIVLSFSVFSQKNSEEFKKELGAEKGYIINNNNEYKEGYIRLGLDSENSKYIDYYKYIKANPIKYDVDSIKEYGYGNKVYENFSYKGKKVFMQRLNNKEPYLYYYKNTKVKEFFLKKNDELQVLPSNKKELVNTLQNELDSCKKTENIITLATYNKSRLASIFSRYDECSDKKIPYFKIGIHSGLDMSMLKLNPDYFISYNNARDRYFLNRDIDYNSPLGIYYGIFMDFPLSYKHMKLSFRPELEFSNKKYEVTSYQGDLSFDISYTNVNIFLRNNSLNNKVSFYIDYGLIVSIINTQNIKIENDNDVELNFSNILYGVGLGCGIDIPVFKRNTLNIGVKGNLLTGDKNISSLLNTGLYLGFSF